MFALTPSEAACEAHPGRHCDECQATLYVDAAADVYAVCKRPMCPSYDPRVWPKWADKDRYFEQKRRDEAAERERREAEPVPE